MKAQIKEILDDVGAYWFMPPSNGYNVAGIPDFVGCYKGKFFAIEAKSNKTTHPVTALQQRQIDLITSHQGLALVIDEMNLHTLTDTIRGLNNDNRK